MKKKLENKYVKLFVIFFIAILSVISLKFANSVDLKPEIRADDVKKLGKNEFKVKVVSVSDRTLRGEIKQLPKNSRTIYPQISKDSEIIFIYNSEQTNGIKEGSTVIIKIPVSNDMTSSNPPRVSKTTIVNKE